MYMDPRVKQLRRIKIPKFPSQFPADFYDVGSKRIIRVPELAHTPALPILRQLKNKLAPVASSAADAVQRALTSNGINIDLADVSNLMKTIKQPTIAALGVAGVAGVIYLMYKLYKAYESGDLERIAKQTKHTAEELYEEFKSTSPDLLSLPGWGQQIKDKITSALSDDPEQAANKIARLKEEVETYQSNLGRPVGNGVILSRARRHIGAGAGMPIL